VSDEEYLQSIRPHDNVAEISLLLVAKFSEGRSGAFFFYTEDQNYLIKTLTKAEAKLMIKTLPQYVDYMRQNAKNYLGKYFGLHAIKLYGHRIFFVVTKNIFSALDATPDEIYDIKGSWVGRNTNNIIWDRKLMKDNDLHRELLLESEKSNAIYKQLEKDTEFLASLKIMDYSLLLGVVYKTIKQNKNDPREQEGDDMKSHSDAGFDDESSHSQHTEILEAEMVVGPGKYVIGIIDMLQKYNMRKKSERCIKSICMCKDKNGISCAPPYIYRDRFLEKMSEIGIG